MLITSLTLDVTKFSSSRCWNFTLCKPQCPTNKDLCAMCTIGHVSNHKLQFKKHDLQVHLHHAHSQIVNESDQYKTHFTKLKTCGQMQHS
jgi:hypothetical protein